MFYGDALPKTYASILIYLEVEYHMKKYQYAFWKL